MLKTIGDEFENLEGKWLIVQWNPRTDEFICKKKSNYGTVIKNFKRSIVEGE